MPSLKNITAFLLQAVMSYDELCRKKLAYDTLENEFRRTMASNVEFLGIFVWKRRERREVGSAGKESTKNYDELLCIYGKLINNYQVLNMRS